MLKRQGDKVSSTRGFHSTQMKILPYQYSIITPPTSMMYPGNKKKGKRRDGNDAVEEQQDSHCQGGERQE